MLKRARRLAPHSRNTKQTNAPNSISKTPYRRSIVIGNVRKPHAKARMLGRNAEGDDIGQRIQLLAEVAGGIRHARNAPVERVKWKWQTGSRVRHSRKASAPGATPAGLCVMA